MQSTILIIEDDADINQLLAKILSDTGCRTLQAYSATEAGLLMEKETVDLILLDLMLPGVPGEAFLKELREVRHLDLPVLVISAKNSLDSKVSLLNSGADDYITKPFEPQEVLARVQAGMRRCQKGRPMEEKLSYKRLVLYPEARKAVLAGKELALTAHEYDILLLLVQHPDKVYSRESLYELVWQGGYYGENNTVNVHVSNIRKKIKEADPFEEYIQTVYGIGFKLS
ncbi:MAG: response regulator transcription factor [Eubacterium sp.]|nr:response regulator transcription factor [Eubacterium sp.]MCI8920038.1 response regulator transcription factor [Eubacterium sp.]